MQFKSVLITYQNIISPLAYGFTGNYALAGHTNSLKFSTTICGLLTLLTVTPEPVSKNSLA
jgi:hypothetical protein